MSSSEFTAHHRPAEGPSERKFGLTMAVASLLIGALPLLEAAPPRYWLLAVAAAFLAAALLWPRGLAPLNAAWFKLGDLMARVVGPVALGVLFFGVITPIGGLMRALGKRPLSLSPDRGLKTYWVERDRNPSAEAFRDQF
ncbi:MAG: hypothetical protein FGM40_02215 [Rhodocyclaceae bacterium]|nr:hypothetical protein [Rhodocyclaceae bacterium]